MRRSTLEIVMGLVVLAGAAGFTALVYQLADLKTSNGYEIGADFGTTGGLVVGDDVRLSGIKVGRIVSQTLDPVTYTARINMQIDNSVKLPEDSSARITAASLLGGNFEILPGSSDELFRQGRLSMIHAIRLACLTCWVNLFSRTMMLARARAVSGCLPLSPGEYYSVRFVCYFCSDQHDGLCPAAPHRKAGLSGRRQVTDPR